MTTSRKGDVPMPSITLSDVFTIIYVLVDDWYQTKGIKLLQGKPGPKPIFTDSEVITLMLAQDYIPYPSETQYLEFIRANFLDLFPKLVDQSQYNRRARSLYLLVEELRRYWITKKGWHNHTCYIMDTKPVPVIGYKRSKRRSDFLGSADYGLCVSRNLKYFGYKLIIIATLDGIPVVYDLVPANVDERLAAEAVIDHLSYCDVLADKGFIGLEWQARIFDQTGNLIWTPRRANQYYQNTPAFDRWLSSVRERIEGVFHEIQNVGRNIERLLAKTVRGLSTRVVAKLASHILRRLLRSDFGVNVQNFSIIAEA
jgi:hypothetical protein